MGKGRAPWSSTLAAAIGALLLLVVVAPARSYEQQRSEHNARVRVADLPVRVRISAPIPGISGGGAPALRRAMAEWGSVPCTSLRFVEAAEGEDARALVRYAASGFSHGDTLAAHTSVRSDPRTGAVEEAIIELNGAFQFTDVDPVPSDALDLESVFLHELGHVIGLAHSSDRRGVMHAGTKPGAAPRRALADDDIRGVCAIYPAGAADLQEPPPLPGAGSPSWGPGAWAIVAAAASGFVVCGLLLWRRARAR
jgi:hypothetical protein